MHAAPAIAMIAALAVSLASSRCCAQASVPPAETVQIPVRPLPFDLQGYLRRPRDAATAPAVVLLPHCGIHAKAVDQDWGATISSWGYATLTIDSFGPRGIKTCRFGDVAESDLAYDAYRGLNFLAQEHFAGTRRAAIVGFALGASQTLAAVERGAVEKSSERKFRAAAVFHPFCGRFRGIMTVPTLILIGERDDLASVDACRKLAAGEDDMGVSRQKGEGAPVRLIVYPDAHFGFDLQALRTPVRFLGHRLAFNQAAADQSREALREFLNATLGSAARQ